MDACASRARMPSFRAGLADAAACRHPLARVLVARSLALDDAALSFARSSPHEPVNVSSRRCASMRGHAELGGMHAIRRDRGEAKRVSSTRRRRCDELDDQAELAGGRRPRSRPERVVGDPDGRSPVSRAPVEIGCRPRGRRHETCRVFVSPFVPQEPEEAALPERLTPLPRRPRRPATRTSAGRASV